jgi:hypothetical protein
MASAFSLFGELGVDTRAFVASMKYADNRMKASERLFIEMEKSKMRMAERSASHQQRLSEITARVIQKSLSAVGSAMQSAGAGLTVGLTAPLLAIEGTAIRSAIGFDTLRTQLAAATGSTESASSKFKELNKLAQENAGVLTAGAVATYNFLKPLGFAEGTINEVIKAFGKLKAANPEVDLQRMATNLGQLFDQGFEQQDVKELVGNFPRALEIMKKAFNLKSSDRKGIAEEMKGLMGKGLTREQFFAAFAGGVNTDQFLSKVTDPIAVRFEKLKERIMLALEPLGVIILTNLERWLPSIVAFIERLSAAFTSLSPTMQMIVTALSAVAIAAGPVLFAVGQIVSAIGSLGLSLPAMGTIAGVIAGIGAVLAPIIFTATFFAQEWLRNWELVKQIFWTGYEVVSQTVTSLLTTIQGLWAEHGSGVMDFLSQWWTTLSSAISGWFGIIAEVLTVALRILQGDWAGVWQGILDLTSVAFSTLTEWFANAMTTLIKFVQAAGPVILQAFTWIWGKVLELATAAVKGVIDAFVYLPEYLLSIVPRLITAGLQIGNAIKKGIWEGLSNWWQGVGGASASAGSSMANSGGFLDGLLNSFRSLTGGGMSLSAGGNLGGGSTFLSPVLSDAIKTTTALDNVKNKINQVKATASTVKASAMANKAIEATITRGDGSQFRIGSFDTLLGKDDSAMAIAAAVGEAIKQKDPNRLDIILTDAGNRTTLGATSAAVNARYRN